MTIFAYPSFIHYTIQIFKKHLLGAYCYVSDVVSVTQHERCPVLVTVIYKDESDMILSFIGQTTG